MPRPSVHRRHWLNWSLDWLLDRWLLHLCCLWFWLSAEHANRPVLDPDGPLAHFTNCRFTQSSPPFQFLPATLSHTRGTKPNRIVGSSSSAACSAPRHNRLLPPSSGLPDYQWRP